MNREDAKTLLPIIEAFANGETIECLQALSSTWDTLGDDCRFDSLAGRYRIKPKEPREFWLTDGENGWVAAVEPIHATGYEEIKVREVMSDD